MSNTHERSARPLPPLRCCTLTRPHRLNLLDGLALNVTHYVMPAGEARDDVGDVLDASVRYAKSWRAEGAEVFGPALMLDLVSMVREATARAERAEGTRP